MEVIKGRVYRHYKGDYYIVVDIAVNSDDLTKFVIYRGLYGDGPLWIREITDFIALLDDEKRIKYNQEYRFQLQDIQSVVKR